MDTRAVAHEVRLREWAEIMRQRTASGLSIKAWCEAHGIGRQQYFYWQRKLREAACSELSGRTPSSETQLVPSGWARLESQAAVSAEPGITIEIDGFRVTATASTDPALLAEVFRALKSL